MSEKVKLYVVRNTPDTAMQAVVMFDARGVPRPAIKPDGLVAVATAEHGVVAAVGIRHKADSERIEWMCTSPRVSRRLRHAAMSLALANVIDVALVQGLDVTVDVKIPWGVLMLLRRIAGEPQIERTARFAPTMSRMAEFYGVRKRRPSARAARTE